MKNVQLLYDHPKRLEFSPIISTKPSFSFNRANMSKSAFNLVTVIFLIVTSSPLFAQNAEKLKDKIASTKGLEEYLDGKYVPVKKGVDSNWNKWNDVRYFYGFDKNEQPVYNTVNGVLESDTMISVRGGKGRWNHHKFFSGGHVFEGWSGKELSRLTMVMGKFQETFACIQTYSPAGLYEKERRFGWIKMGSDEKKKGVDFSQGWTNFYTPLTLQRRKEAPEAVKDADLNPQLKSDKVPVGTMYYDTTLQKVRVMTEEGWKSFVLQ